MQHWQQLSKRACHSDLAWSCKGADARTVQCSALGSTEPGSARWLQQRAHQSDLTCSSEGADARESGAGFHSAAVSVTLIGLLFARAYGP